MVPRDAFRALDDVIAIPWVITLLNADRAQRSVMEAVYDDAVTACAITIARIAHTAWTVEPIIGRCPAVARVTWASEREAYPKTATVIGVKAIMAVAISPAIIPK